MITYEDFKKLELKVGKIEQAEPVAGADRLLKLVVDLGEEKREMVAGIAFAYKPEELVGKSVIVVVNLEPATIRGVRSEGMLLATWNKSDYGTLSLLTVDREAAPGQSVS
jgi:methionine--tRNA ligase beta chain